MVMEEGMSWTDAKNACPTLADSSSSLVSIHVRNVFYPRPFVRYNCKLGERLSSSGSQSFNILKNKGINRGKLICKYLDCPTNDKMLELNIKLPYEP